MFSKIEDTAHSYFTGRGGLVWRDLDERLNSEELIKFGDYSFIVNENVHKTGRRLRGVLVCTYYNIGYIVKANGTMGVYQPMLPKKGKLHLVLLFDQNMLPELSEDISSNFGAVFIQGFTHK